MRGHFSGVFIHNFTKVVKELMVLVVQDERFMKRAFDGTYRSLQDNGDVKMPGGMSEIVSGDGREETPEETEKREAVSETGVQILSEKLILHEIKKDRRTQSVHHRYFFLATEVSGLPGLDSPPRIVEETNPSDGSVEKLICYWLPLRQFADRLFRGQHQAFGAMLEELARDEKFYTEFSDLFRKFPAPQREGA
jgi:ADP-ribose pyrophosphatase YjhB (NUDIX family)